MDQSINTISASLGSTTEKIISIPLVIIILVIIVIMYIIVFIILGNNSSTESTSMMPSLDLTSSATTSSESNPIKQIVIGLVVIALLIIILRKTGIIDKIITMFLVKADINPDPTSRLGAIKSEIPQIIIKKQVFNIPENDYVYPDAKAVCKAYGARLATYKEVEDAYRDGGEWCNYGWSDGQMALFPTQQKTFDKLQKIEGHENDCGRPGVNGGYMKNPGLRFGVNCYGFKPRMTELDEERMETMPIYPKTEKDIAMENRVKYWKERLTEILISPFNHTNWSRI